MTARKAKSLRQVKLLVDCSRESREVVKLLADSRSLTLLLEHGVEVAHIPIGGNSGPELHDGSRILFSFNEINNWLEELRKE